MGGHAHMSTACVCWCAYVCVGVHVCVFMCIACMCQPPAPQLQRFFRRSPSSSLLPGAASLRGKKGHRAADYSELSCCGNQRGKCGGRAGGRARSAAGGCSRRGLASPGAAGWLARRAAAGLEGLRAPGSGASFLMTDPGSPLASPGLALSDGSPLPPAVAQEPAFPLPGCLRAKHRNKRMGCPVKPAGLPRPAPLRAKPWH